MPTQSEIFLEKTLKLDSLPPVFSLPLGVPPTHIIYSAIRLFFLKMLLSDHIFGLPTAHLYLQYSIHIPYSRILIGLAQLPFLLFLTTLLMCTLHRLSQLQTLPSFLLQRKISISSSLTIPLLHFLRNLMLCSLFLASSFTPWDLKHLAH